MDGEEAAKLVARCNDLRRLAGKMKNGPNRKLLLDTADKFEALARDIADRHRG